MKRILITYVISGVLLTSNAQDFGAFTRQFVADYKALHIRSLDLSYETGLQNIGSPASIRKEVEFFQSIREKLSAFKAADLTGRQRLDYELIDYECGLNLERLALEAKWAQNRPAATPANGIYNIPDGKAWYLYLLKRWLSADVTPDSIFQFGLSEITRVKTHIEAIRAQTGMSEADFYKHLNDPSFFTSDQGAIQEAFERMAVAVNANLHKVFEDYHIPALQITQGTDRTLAQAPGYYNDDIFYYNLFDKPYNKRQFGWLFIHEGIPGHHFQMSISNRLDISPVQQLFFYSGFVEGWGAYAEELGGELGAYKTPYDELGKWEWDIVRSVRVPLDVGLNYYGWTDDQALDFWKKNIRNQDDIAMREIKRLRRWPAQAITYKYGAAQIMSWKEKMRAIQGARFDERAFHAQVLKCGVLPLGLIKERVLEGPEAQGQSLPPINTTLSTINNKLFHFVPTSFSNSFSLNIPPVLTINSGDTVSTETIDAMGRDRNGVKRQRGGNPLTGPFYVANATQGDVLMVTLNKVTLNRPYAYTTEAFVKRSLPDSITRQFKKARLVKWDLDVAGGFASLDSGFEKLKNFKVPLAPFLGCIGVAPSAKNNELLSFFSGPFGGNLDYKGIAQSATIYLPVLHDGAFLYIGDGHALQGDGELAGNALETSMDVEFTVRIIKNQGQKINYPRVEDTLSIMAIGLDTKLDGALKIATSNLLDWLQSDYKLSLQDATQVMSTSIEYAIAEIADPEVEVVAKINKKTLLSLR